jgi:hypothetical protein
VIEGSIVLALRVDDGRIEGVDVSGLGVALSALNVGVEAKWQAMIYVDERATPVEHDALLKLVTGQLVGALPQVPALVGEVRSIERSPIALDVDQHQARLSVGKRVGASRVSSYCGSRRT